MNTELTRQASLFVIFIFNGCIIGIIFDIFRILRKSFKTKDFITSIQDILFCIITGFFLIYTIFIFNNGEIRFYIIVGLLIGLILYLLLLSKYIIRISIYIIDFLKKITSFILHIIINPIRLIISIFKKPCRFIFINIRKLLTKNTNIRFKFFKKGK